MSDNKLGRCELCFDGYVGGKPAITQRRVAVSVDFYGEQVEWRLFATCEACAHKGVTDGEQPDAKKGSKL